jgi:hypothetical protein
VTAAQIQAIPTSYAGCLFRSRIEARWAVFFDHLGIRWEHEPEGFETSAGRYLPDFRIRTVGRSQWFEVKPEDAPEDPRHAALAVESGMPVVIARGMARGYREQMGYGARPWLTAYVDGQRVRCAFVAGQQGYVEIARGGRRILHPEHGGTLSWAWIGKNGIWHCDSTDSPHLAVHSNDAGCVGACGRNGTAEGCGHTPLDSLDVDAAYSAARSERFGT